MVLPLLCGLSWTVGAALLHGIVEREPDTPLARCDAFDFPLTWIGIGGAVATIYVRLYRNYSILIHHQSDLWPAWAQAVLVIAPYLMAPLVYAIFPSTWAFNPVTNMCEGDRTLAMIGMIVLLIQVTKCVAMNRALKSVRIQFNEHKQLRIVFRGIMGAAITYFLIEFLIFPRNHLVGRLLTIVQTTATTIVLFWPLVGPLLKKTWTKDQEFLHQHTYGFATLPTIAIMKAAGLKEQLRYAEFRRYFKEYCDQQMAIESIKFYEACLERESLNDWNAVQAKTMAIIDQFIRAGSKLQINISHNMREKILSEPDLNRPDFFAEAKREVLTLMDLSLNEEFHKSAAYRGLQDAVESHTKELEALKGSHMIPDGTAELVSTPLVISQQNTPTAAAEDDCCGALPGSTTGMSSSTSITRPRPSYQAAPPPASLDSNAPLSNSVRFNGAVGFLDLIDTDLPSRRGPPQH